MYDKKTVSATVAKVLEGKGKRKFTQSVDLAANFQEIDLKKTENRISLDIILPYAPKKVKVGVFADGDVAYNAKKIADAVIGTAEIDAITKDKKKEKDLTNYVWLAEPKLMATVGKAFGKSLGAKGKLPKPLLPGTKLEDAISRTKNTITLKTKGKNLPSIHCIIGNENMPAEEITENVMVVLEGLGKKVTDNQIKSIYLKTTMGPAIRIGD